jgi:hypothetical protein
MVLGLSTAKDHDGTRAMRLKRIKQERRRYPRWMVEGRFAARISPIHEAALIDMSPAGALVEHLNRLQPGTTLFLTLPFLQNGNKKIGLRCKVVRSVAHRPEVASTGERDVIYRSGLEFLGTLQPFGSPAAAVR